MIVFDFEFFDKARNRNVPVVVYLPDGEVIEKLPTIINNPGYGGGQEKYIECEKGLKVWPYKNYTYLAEFFTKKGYALISIQHDVLGDKDGLETINPNENQAIARRHLWLRGEENILFVIEELKKKKLGLNLEKFIICGHSNGADIAKFFANKNSTMISFVISLDGRRCPVATDVDLKILSFEANDTTTDIGVIPDEGTQENQKRSNLEWVIIKPKNAIHMSYSDDGKQIDVKKCVCKAIELFRKLNCF